MYRIAQLVFEVLQLGVFQAFEAVVFVVSCVLLSAYMFRRDK